MFNLMFKTHLGPVDDSASQVYLRPETAQGIFVNFPNVCDSTRVKVPFGIAQQGKSFRNEISTRRFIFRMAEFEQMEMEFFIEPGTDAEWFEYWKKERFNWYLGLGVRSESLKIRDHDKDELSHYSIGTSDIEFLFPFGWGEVEGIACRGNYDLTQHSEFCGKQLLWRDQINNKSYIPHVIEPAAGTDRIFATVLCDAYQEEQVDGNERVVLKLHPRIAPVKVAIFPLLRKDGHPEKAEEIYKTLNEFYYCQYDDSGTIGRRYRRQDEAGTPLCITVDHQTLEDQTVTVRDRDTLTQDRVAIGSLREELFKRLGF
jgi:glycyl-tRNA synthetase